MANPSVIARTTPTGWKMPEGFRVTIAPSIRPNIQFWEVGVKPGGFTSVRIDTSTQHNISLKTKAMSALADYGDITGQAGYDPDFFADILVLHGDMSGSLTVHMPDHSTINYWAGLADFDFQELKIGAFPMANYGFVVTNWDPNNGVEWPPYFVAASGT